MRPHRRQPTRLPRPWDSPGKNTGVGCHFLLQCMKVKSESDVPQSCLTLSDPMDCSPPGSSVHGIFQARVLEWGAIAFSDFVASACIFGASLVVQMVYRICLQRGRPGFVPGLGRSSGEGNGYPLQYPWTEELGGLQSMGSQRVRHDWVINTFNTCIFLLFLAEE